MSDNVQAPLPIKPPHSFWDKAFSQGGNFVLVILGGFIVWYEFQEMKGIYRETRKQEIQLMEKLVETSEGVMRRLEQIEDDLRYIRKTQDE